MYGLSPFDLIRARIREKRNSRKALKITGKAHSFCSATMISSTTQMASSADVSLENASAASLVSAATARWRHLRARASASAALSAGASVGSEDTGKTVLGSSNGETMDRAEVKFRAEATNRPENKWQNNARL